ncbi:hypothetical protein [Cellulophaga sp. L1A9]|uniref:hypothetical protein n=1 Tax=Cellulophaga sp. L1A9 TaxID=2686362 RepID=UPI00131A8C3F|nr:hypothetical protein [Cellulophaga sp. L1A9]
MDKNIVKELKTKYDLINKETKELNYMLYHTLSQYISVEKDNFKKLSDLFLIIPKIESLNGKKFESNSILANELE